MRMRFLNMAHFWVAMLCRACRITHMRRGYPVVVIWNWVQNGWRQDSLFKQHKRCVHCVLCLTFHGSCAALGMKSGVHAQEGWLGCGTWCWFPQSVHGDSASGSVSPCVFSHTEKLCRISTGVPLHFWGFLCHVSPFDLPNSHSEYTLQSDR